MVSMKIYLAGPLFTEGERSFCVSLKERLKNMGFEVLWPWELTDQKSNSPLLNRRIFDANVAAIESADFLVAILDGCDVDSGTAWELGYAHSRGKKVFGIRTDFRLSGDNHESMVNIMVSQSLVKAVRTIGQLEEALSSYLPLAEAKAPEKVACAACRE